MAPCIWDLLFPSTQWQISVSPCPLWPWQACNPNSLSHFIACLQVWVCPVLLSDRLRSHAFGQSLQRWCLSPQASHPGYVASLCLMIEGIKPLIIHWVRCWMMSVSTVNKLPLTIKQHLKGGDSETRQLKLINEHQLQHPSVILIASASVIFWRCSSLPHASYRL